MELILIIPETPEWNYLWEWLSVHPLNEGIQDPTSALHENEQWEYMGSYRQDNRVIHSLRHRFHPKTLRVETVSVSASKDLTPEQIAKNFKL